MRFVIQRVTEGEVRIDGRISGSVKKGYVVLIGVCDTDTEEIADKMVKKMLALRIFEDGAGKTNLSLTDIGGGLLLISQFTLYADLRRGNRPSFTRAGGPEKAEKLYDHIVKRCRESGFRTETGEFGAHMMVSLVNDGPFTILLGSEDLEKPRKA